MLRFRKVTLENLKICKLPLASVTSNFQKLFVIKSKSKSSWFNEKMKKNFLKEFITKKREPSGMFAPLSPCNLGLNSLFALYRVFDRSLFSLKVFMMVLLFFLGNRHSDLQLHSHKWSWKCDPRIRTGCVRLVIIRKTIVIINHLYLLGITYCEIICYTVGILYVYFLVPPTLHTNEDREITVFVGESLVMDCSVIGIPQPSVAWSKVSIASLNDIACLVEFVLGRYFNA